MNSNTFHKIGYGMYILSTAWQGRHNGQIVNTVFQITAEPALFGISVNKQTLTHELLCQSRVLSLSILERATPLTFLGTFGFKSGRTIDKFEKVNCQQGKNGCPIVTDHSLGYMEARVVDTYDAGTHTLFIVQIDEAEITSDHEPLTYAQYHQEKGGKSPKGAPTYLAPQTNPLTKATV